jgi:hypothetical protein
LPEFVEQKFRLYTDPYHAQELKRYEASNHFITVAGTQALKIDEGLGADVQPDIFVAHRGRVIHLQISYPGRHIPPYDPPCDKTLELFEKILNSIILHP